MHTQQDWITTPVTAGLLRGALDAERTEHGVLPHRLPARARARAQNTDGQLATAESQPSGVRLVDTPAVHGFLDTIREGHPDAPLLVVSPLLCRIHEDTPGPCALDLTALSAGRLRFMAMGDPAERASGAGTAAGSSSAPPRVRATPGVACSDGPGLYSSVPAYADWIRKTIDSNR
ncbi:hypothetical protein ACFWBX_19220 [Streptomyces sp. NPDC059991]|uniref:hypothetical protein n=1 Tax=Streptomyces sp. NPDC059991 TaxID=3347028 RepID=UPI0036B2403F